LSLPDPLRDLVLVGSVALAPGNICEPLHAQFLQPTVNIVCKIDEPILIMGELCYIVGQV
jgi:hypothetical protein